MKSFRNYISEEVIPTALVKDGSIDLNREDVRENLNVLLARAVEKPCVTPYIALNKVRKILDNFHIELPRRTFLEGSRGLEVFDLHQFGHKMGMTDQGEFVKEVPANYFLFLKYETLGSMFVVVAKVLDKDNLDKYLDYAEGSLAEDAQMQQSLSKAKAPKEEPHTALGDCDCGPGDSESTKSAIATSMRKKDKKLSAGSLDEDADIDMEGHKRRIKKLRSDVLEEEMSHDARELATYADNHAQLHRSSHQPIVKNLQRKHAKGTYDHEKAEKLWGYHAKRAADAYHKEFGHKFSVAHRKEAAKHMADEARTEHGFGTTKEETQLDELSKDTLRSYVAKRGSQLGSMKYGPDRPRKPLTGRQQKNAVIGIKRAMKEETIDEGYASIGHSFDWAGDVNRKARFYGKKPKATTTKNDEKDDTYKGSKQGGKVKFTKSVKEDKDPCWKGYDMVGMKKKGGKSVPNCVPVKEEKKPKPVNLSPKQEQDKKIPNSLASYREKIYQARLKQLRKEETLDETRMPASVIRHKQKLANMTPEEKAKKFAGKSEEQLKSMARRHGYGKDSTEYSKHKKLDEKAPPGAKFERMVKHIKKGYAKDDGLTKKEKSIAYATAWKAKNREESE